MKTYTFTKLDGAWFITLPAVLREYNKTDFTLVEREGGALDEIAGGISRVAVYLDRKPFEKALVLELETFVDAVELGYYRLYNGEGNLLKEHLPLSELSLLLYGELPERIYLQRKITSRTGEENQPGFSSALFPKINR